MKPKKLYWRNELLDYFVGTTDWAERTEISNWLDENSSELKPNVFVCTISDNPFVKFTSQSDDIKMFIHCALHMFGTYDYEINPLNPCGGWKELDVIFFKNEDFNRAPSAE